MKIKNSWSGIFIIMFLLIFPLSRAYANGATTDMTKEYEVVQLVFLGWLLLGIVPLVMTRMLNLTHLTINFITFLSLIFVPNAGGFTVYWPTIWAFFVCWLLIFNIFDVYRDRKKEDIVKLARNGLAVIAIIIMTSMMTKVENGPDAVYELWKKTSYHTFLILAAIAFLFSISARARKELEKKSFADVLRGSIKDYPVIIAIGITGLIILPLLFGPLVTSRYYYFFNSEYLYGDTKLEKVAEALNDYYLDHGAFPEPVIGRDKRSSFNLAEEWHPAFDKLSAFPLDENGSIDYLKLKEEAWFEDFRVDAFSIKGAPFAYYCDNSLPEPAWIIWGPGPDGIYDLDLALVKELMQIYDPEKIEWNEIGEAVIGRFKLIHSYSFEKKGDYFVPSGQEYVHCYKVQVIPE